MSRKGLLGTLVILAGLFAFTAAGIGEEAPANYGIVTPTTVQLDGKAEKDARVYANAEKTVYLVCIPSDANIYKVDRKGKKVVAVKRSSVMVKQEKCRPVEGAKEMAMAGHLFAETKEGFSFNDLGGHKVTVALPAGAKR